MRFIMMCGIAGVSLLTGCNDKPEKDESAQLEEMVLVEDQGAAKNIADQSETPLIEDIQKE